MSNYCLFNNNGSCVNFSNTNCGNNSGIIVTRPWNRFENNCYSNVSNFNLNMRRKAEILKYKNNSNNLTKREKYANF